MEITIKVGQVEVYVRNPGGSATHTLTEAVKAFKEVWNTSQTALKPLTFPPGVRAIPGNPDAFIMDCKDAGPTALPKGWDLQMNYAPIQVVRNEDINDETYLRELFTNPPAGLDVVIRGTTGSNHFVYDGRTWIDYSAPQILKEMISDVDGS